MADEQNTPKRRYTYRGWTHGLTEEESFWEKVDKSGECWIWMAATVPPGYGHFRSTSAHRWAYRWANGPIPDGLEIDHTCRVVGCVNPAHLEAVTRDENLRRKVEGARSERRCKRGHEWTDENTYWMPNGCRQCIECRRILNKARYERQQASR